MLQRLQDYAAARKAWLEARRQDIHRQVEASGLQRQYRELRALWRGQLRLWRQRTARYA